MTLYVTFLTKSYKCIYQLLYHLACPLPKSFTLKDSQGRYWCLNDEGHLRTEDHCRCHCTSKKRHIFRTVTGEDDDDVPLGICSIQSAYDDSFVKTTGKKGQLEPGDNISLDESNYHFIVTYVDTGKVNIFSVDKDKYLKMDGHQVKAKGNENCGDACQFTIEEEVSASILPDPQGIHKKEIKINKISYWRIIKFICIKN